MWCGMVRKLSTRVRSRLLNKIVQKFKVEKNSNNRRGEPACSPYCYRRAGITRKHFSQIFEYHPSFLVIPRRMTLGTQITSWSRESIFLPICHPELFGEGSIWYLFLVFPTLHFFCTSYYIFGFSLRLWYNFTSEGCLEMEKKVKSKDQVPIRFS